MLNPLILYKVDNLKRKLINKMRDQQRNFKKILSEVKAGSGAGCVQEVSCLSTGDWVFLVQATSDQAPLVWAKSIRGLMQCVPTKHHTLLLSLPWERTHPAAATAKCSGQCPDTWSLSLPKTQQLGAAGTALPVWAKWDRCFLCGLHVVGANCCSCL